MVTKFSKDGNELWRYVHDNSSTFKEFIYNCTDEVEIKKGVYYSFTYNQLDYVTDENGNLLVDFIGRLENFDDDVHEVFNKIGVPLERVPHKNRSRHQHYSTFYTPDTEMIVRERFKRDIEYFGYEFERPHTIQNDESKISVASGQDAQRRIDVGVGWRPRRTGVEVRADRTPKDDHRGKPGILFVCGCDTSGVTALANYLNHHPEIFICQERSQKAEQGEVTLDLSTLGGMLDAGPKKTKVSTSNIDGKPLMKHDAELLAHKDQAILRWVGASNSYYVRCMESVAANNPGARFIVMYRPIEEVAESWDTKDSGYHPSSNGGFEQAAKDWNRSLQGTRRFIRDSLVPRVLLISYHDFLYQREIVVPLISRFLELEFDKSATAERPDEGQQSERGRPKETISSEKRSSIQKLANRAAEAWILDRIDKQWKEPGLYTQETSNAALATSLDEMEARTWRLQQKVKELERDRESRRRKFKQLKNSRTWRLVNKISSVRAMLAGR